MFLYAYGIGALAFLSVIAIFTKTEKISMAWYLELTEQEKKKFWGVIVTVVIGSVLILLVPVVCHIIFYEK